MHELKRIRAAVGWLSFTTILSMAWLGCGESFHDRSSGSGGSATTSSGTAGNTSSGTGGAGSCGQGACGIEGDTCSDDVCCPCIWECRSGQWEIQACAGCAEPTCGYDVPAEGQACGQCSTPPHCDYEDCDGAGVVSATCTPEGKWTLDTEVCVAAPPCGPDPGSEPCPSGKICVKASYSTGPTNTVEYSCEDNPCSPFPTSCDCAVSICQTLNAPLCVSATPRTISCDNGGQ
jgi:hypothetical protein